MEQEVRSSSWQDPSSLNHWGTPEEATGSGAYWQSQGIDIEDGSGTEADTSPDSGHEDIGHVGPKWTEPR